MTTRLSQSPRVSHLAENASAITQTIRDFGNSTAYATIHMVVFGTVFISLFILLTYHVVQDITGQSRRKKTLAHHDTMLERYVVLVDPVANTQIYIDKRDTLAYHAWKEANEMPSYSAIPPKYMISRYEKLAQQHMPKA